MTLYHVTHVDNLDSILQNGLIPTIGKYSKEMGETEPAVWLFQDLDTAEEMTPVWLYPFYGYDLVYLSVELPDDYPLDYSSGSDCEVCVLETITPDHISVYDEYLID